MNRLHTTVNAPARPSRPARTLAVAPFEGFDRTNCLAVQQEIIDDQLVEFTEGELKVMLMITRATNGGQREAVPLSVRVLCEGAAPDTLPGRGTGLSPRTVQAACAALETSGCLRINRRMAPDGSGLPSLFTLPLIVPGLRGPGAPTSARFQGYSAGRRVRLPMLVIDRLLSELSGAELKVLLYVLRHTFCLGVADEVMPMARLVENTGLSLRHTRLAVAGLTARGVIMIQHRQDPERGKLASRFGVKVIGEAAPFTAIPAAPGVAARSVRPEDSAPEQARSVWLVPAMETPAAATPDANAAELARNAVSTPEPIPGDAQQSAQSDTVVSPDNLLAALLARQAAPVAHSTPILVAGQTLAAARHVTPVQPKTITPAMTRDNHPAWAAAKQLLSERLPYQVFVDRIAPTSTVGDAGPELLIAVQDEYHRWWLESKLGRQVRDALEDAGYGDIRMRYLNFSGASQNEAEHRRR